MFTLNYFLIQTSGTNKDNSAPNLASVSPFLEIQVSLKLRSFLTSFAASKICVRHYFQQNKQSALHLIDNEVPTG